MKQLYLLLIFLTLTGSLAYSQSAGTVQGILLDSNQKPLAGLSIALRGTQWGTISDENGKFIITRISAGSYNLMVTGVGFTTTTQTISVQEGKVTDTEIHVSENASQLKEVVVEADQTKDYGKAMPSASLRLNTPLIEVPQNISVVTQQTLWDFGANGTADLARMTSGVIKSYGTASDFAFTIRGTDATNNNFRDGVGGYWWNQQADAFMLDQVEFVKGPAGFMIGNAEPGGIINEVTKQANGKKVRALDFGYGSFNLVRGGVDIGDKFSPNSKFSFRMVAGGQYTNTNYDFYASHHTYLMPSVRYTYAEGSNIQVQLTRMNGFYKGASSGNISFNGTDYLFPSTFNAVDPHLNKGLHNDDNYLRVSHTHKFRNGLRLKTQLADARGRYQGDQMYVSVYNTTFDTLFREYSYSNWRNFLQAAQSFLDGKFKTGSSVEHSFLTGLDFGNSYVIVTGSNFDPDNWGTHFPMAVTNPQYNLSPSDLPAPTIAPESKWGTKWMAWYGQDHIKILDKFIVTLAGRFSYTEAYTNWDSTKVYNTKFTPRAGITYLINKNMSVFALFDETFLPQTGRKQDRTLPKPLTGSNTELGFKAQLLGNKLFINSSIWHTVKNNVLVQNPQTNFYEERGQITSQGFEVSAIGNVTNHVVVNANYTFTDARITKDADPNNVGFRNFGTSKNSANAMVRYRLLKGSLSGLSFGGGIQFVGKRYIAYPGYTSVAEKDMTVPGYTLLDANIGYDVNRLSLQLNVFNIFSAKFMTSPWWNSSGDPAVPGYYSFTANEPVNFRMSARYRF